MATLRDIQRRITAVKNTSKITQAMRMISAAQLRRAQENIESARPYVLKLGEVLANLVESVGESYSHPLIQKPKEMQSVAIIVIASDRGLCGSFNNNLFKYAKKYITDTLMADNPDLKVDIIPVGKRTCSFFKKLEYERPVEYPGIFAELNFDHAMNMVDITSHGFIEGKYDKVLIFFNEFVNVIKQEPTLVQLLPIENTASQEGMEESKKSNVDYIYEPDQASILDELLPKHLNIQMWRTLLESFAAEQAARMMAMENATKNANELAEDLQLQFNKARQAVITTEMLEIVSGAEALNK